MLLVPRQFKISIGGVDHTDCVLSFDGGDDKLSFGSGLIVFRGTIVLGLALGFETLDDRKNKRWNRGTPIAFEIADDSQVMRPSPRGGSLFILSSLYNFDDRTLSLEVGDSFALLSIREGREDKTGVCIGSAENKTIVINRLLTAAGAPALIDAVPGTLSKGSPIFVQGSYIEQAGTIANGSGCFLWVDSLNRVRSGEATSTIANPRITIDLSTQAANYKRLPGESPAAWFVVNAQDESISDGKYGFEFTSESIGPIATAGVVMFGDIVVRREWQKESLSGFTRFVETKVWEPEGAIIPLRSGTANLALSHNKLETFEYESSSPVAGTSAADKCQQGNQGRLKRRTLTVYRPLGAVLDRVIQTAPEMWRPTTLEQPILGLKEIEEFDYGSTIVISSFQQLATPGNLPATLASPNDIPPEDPATKEDVSAYGITHTLKRWEPAGAISPEDFEWDSLIPMWIASASNLAQSYELVKQWTEAREEEWIAIERERISYNRANAEAAADIRDKVKSQFSLSYPRDLFCALQMVRNDRRVSSSGNTQPPAPDTIPSKFKTKTTPRKYKYRTPIDTDFPFRQKTQEFNIEHLSIDGTLLAEHWAKIAWGRFKGMSVQAEFTQRWWDYTPLCRIDVLEPNITPTGDLIDQSAYLADGFAIAVSEGECVIGFDGIFLGFIKDSILNPPYIEISFAEPETVDFATASIVDVVDQSVFIRSVEIISSAFYSASISINPVDGLRIFALSNVIRDAAGTIDSGNAIYNAQTGYREAYKLMASWFDPLSDIPGIPSQTIIERYEVSLRKDGGNWSLPIATTNRYFKIEETLTVIPGISFVSTDAIPYGYVGPGTYDIKIKAISTTGGASETISSQQFPSFAIDITINNPNAGYPIAINDLVILSALISTVSPPIEVKVGFPGYSNQSIQWSLSGPGSIVGNQDSTASFTASSAEYIQGSLNFDNQMSVITASIANTILSDFIEIRQVFQQQSYAVTGVQLFGFVDNVDSNIPSPLAISPQYGGSTYYRIKTNPSTSKLIQLGGVHSGITLGSIIQGTGDFPADVNLLWSIAAGPGRIDYEFHSPSLSDGERAMFVPGNAGTTVIRASAPNGRFGLYTIVNSPVSITGIEFSIPSGHFYFVNSEFTVNAIVQGSGVFSGAVSWSVVSGFIPGSLANNISMITSGSSVAIRIINGSLIGDSIVLRAVSNENSNIFADFTIIAKTNITNVVVIASKSEIQPTDTFSAIAYLEGFGRGTGIATIGTQLFTWAVSGPATLITNAGINTSGTATGTMGSIQITATYEGYSGIETIVNTGIPPDLSVSAIAGYSVSTTGAIAVSGDYGSLNDSLNTTGVAIGDIIN